MRRSTPRPLAAALEPVTRSASPPTLLARVQACWVATVGPVVAAEAEPVHEQGGRLTLACRSAVWAHELELLAPDILERLNEALDPGAPGPLTALRARPAGRTRTDDRRGSPRIP